MNKIFGGKKVNLNFETKTRMQAQIYIYLYIYLYDLYVCGIYVYL